MKLLLTFLAPFINSTGGAEKVCCNMANEMIRRGHDVSILYCFGKSGKPFFPLDDNVHLYNLMTLHPQKWGDSLSPVFPQSQKIIREFFRLFGHCYAHEWQEQYIGKQIQDDLKEMLTIISPDIIVCNWPKEANYLINYAHINIPIFTIFHFGADILAKDSSHGSRIALEKSNGVAVLLKSDLNVLNKYISKAKGYWIPNIVPQYENSTTNLSIQKDIHTIIHVGRFDKHQKRQMLLVHAFAQISKRYPDWYLELWGQNWDPKYRSEIEAFIRKNKLENRIFLKGTSENIEKELARADIFVFPSKYEGFPLAMTEAMSIGLPVIAYQSCTAAAEIIGSDGGLLVRDGINPLADGMETLIKDLDLRIKLGSTGQKKMEQYMPKKIWDTWETLFYEAYSSSSCL